VQIVPGLKRALDYLDTHLSERVTLGALASHAGRSRFHFARLFRASTGCSPMEYLMRLRVERGKRLLESGKESICEIAAHIGFCDQSHFARTFRKHTGMSPRDYAMAWIGWQSSGHEDVVGKLSPDHSRKRGTQRIAS
jgi:AraC family transcriptional regulator